MSTSAPTELWFGSNEENGDTEPWDAYEREIQWRDDDDLGPWTLERYGVRPPEYHLPPVDEILSWFEDHDPEAGDLPIDRDFLAYRISEWSGEYGEVDEWWHDQADEAFDDEAADELIASPTAETAKALREAIADGITYRMAGEHLGTHQLTRTLDGKVLLDDELIGTWDPRPLCCRACDGKEAAIVTHFTRRPVRCSGCKRTDCPRADAHVNACQEAIT